MSERCTILKFPPSSTMTVEQALGSAMNDNLDDVIIIGIKDGNQFHASGSRMSREWSLWLIEHARLHALGRL